VLKKNKVCRLTVMESPLQFKVGLVFCAALPQVYTFCSLLAVEKVSSSEKHFLL